MGTKAALWLASSVAVFACACGGKSVGDDGTAAAVATSIPAAAPNASGASYDAVPKRTVTKAPANPWGLPNDDDDDDSPLHGFDAGAFGPFDAGPSGKPDAGGAIVRPKPRPGVDL